MTSLRSLAFAALFPALAAASFLAGFGVGATDQHEQDARILRTDRAQMQLERAFYAQQESCGDAVEHARRLFVESVKQCRRIEIEDVQAREELDEQ